MNIPPLMVVTPTNVSRIQLPKYHNNDDPILHVRHLAKVCVTNVEDTNARKIQYFPDSLRGRDVD